jgi:hypothetical protein
MARRPFQTHRLQRANTDFNFDIFIISCMVIRSASHNANSICPYSTHRTVSSGCEVMNGLRLAISAMRGHR